MQLSPNFSLAEMVTSQEAARHGIDNAPPPEAVERLRNTCAHLEPVRALLGRSVIITSGYRCPALNALIGSVPSSAHVTGDAADIICPGFGTPDEIAAKIASAGIAFDQLILEGAWVHISFAPAGRQECLTATFDTAGRATYRDSLRG